MSTETKEFGERLARLRTLAGVTQEQMADALRIGNATIGFSRTIVSRLERGERAMPPKSDIEIMARTIGCSLGALLSEDKGFMDNYSEEERMLLMNPGSVDYVRIALAKFARDTAANGVLRTTTDRVLPQYGQGITKNDQKNFIANHVTRS